ncbi:MAG: glycerol-3-phosphate dehydrogenase (NAD(P)+) [Rickettsiales bacterium]|jgi:glycerol-3-phosphate dehydrogenase (NAD(P)+)
MTIENNPKITIIGAGAWGSAIASVLASNNHEVLLYCNEDIFIDNINKRNISPRLPDVKLSKKITASKDFKDSVFNADYLFFVVPSSVVNLLLDDIRKIDQNFSKKIIICTKGVDEENLQLFSDIFDQKLPKSKYCFLSGPNFAVEVVAGVKTITNIASKDQNLAQEFQNLLENNYFKITILDDIITTQIAGSMKNILAIGCGIISGLNLGENVKAGFVTSGILEIAKMIDVFNGNSKNLVSASGFGDLFLTCSSKKSRNFSLGFEIAKGKDPAILLSDVTKTFEGAKSVKIFCKLAKNKNVELPVCNLIYDILFSGLSADRISY